MVSLAAEMKTVFPFSFIVFPAVLSNYPCQAWQLAYYPIFTSFYSSVIAGFLHATVAPLLSHLCSSNLPENWNHHPGYQEASLFGLILLFTCNFYLLLETMFYNMFCWSFAVLNDGDHTLLCCSLIEIKNSDMLPMQFWYSASKINFPYEKNWTLAVVWGETYRPIHIYFIYKKPSNKIRSLHLILTCMNCARSARTSL